MGWFRRFENNRSQLEHNGVFFRLLHRHGAAGFRLWPRVASAVNLFAADLVVYLALEKRVAGVAARPGAAPQRH